MKPRLGSTAGRTARPSVSPLGGPPGLRAAKGAASAAPRREASWQPRPQAGGLRAAIPNPSKGLLEKLESWDRTAPVGLPTAVAARLRELKSA